MKRTNWKRVADENMAVAEQAADAANAAADERDALRAEVRRLKRGVAAALRNLADDEDKSVAIFTARRTLAALSPRPRTTNRAAKAQRRKR